MARVVGIRYTPHVHTKCPTGSAQWTASPTRSHQNDFPQLLWKDLTPWREANAWALDCLLHSGVALSTIRTNMAALLAYANWLETSQSQWWHFPDRKADRCLVRYRGALISAHSESRVVRRLGQGSDTGGVE